MAEVSVSALAKSVGIDEQQLLQKLKEANLPQTSVDDLVSDEQKQVLLSHIRGGQTVSPTRITLKRKSTSALKQSGGARGKTVNIEIRQKKTYPSPEEIARQRTAEEAERLAAEQAAREKQERLAREKAEAEAAEKQRQQAERAQAAETQTAAKSENNVAETTDVAKSDTTEVKNPTKPIEEVDPFEKKRKQQARQRTQDRKTSSKQGLRQQYINYGDDDNDVEDEAAARPKITRAKPNPNRSKTQAFQRPTENKVHEVKTPENLTVAELAQRMSVKAAQVIKIMMGMGVMATVNQVVDQETAVLVVEEMGHKPVIVSESALEDALMQQAAPAEDVETAERPPIVTIMGHVDHGKTSLLDYIRRTRVTDAEAGGITQHIGAYHVETEKGIITFLDTPGHAAFTAMRARGANLTDIVVLVVAADDGVMPQTIEAIQHAKAAGVPIIVAVNKIDKPEADPEKIKNELTQHEIIPEDWGGEHMFVEVSAKKGTGIDSLLEGILLQAEVQELRAVATGAARGVVVESRLDKGLGVVATLLVQSGLLHKGDIVLTGVAFGKVRALLDENRKPVKSAGPSIPVEVLGLSAAPVSGDEFIVVPNERKAREVSDYRREKQRNTELSQPAMNLDDIFSNFKEQNAAQQLSVILKADAQGSLEALTDSLHKLSNDEVAVKVIASGVGGITESDVNLALASGAVMFGFNVRADAIARGLAEKEGLQLRYYSIIYQLLDDVKQALSGMLPPEMKEEIIGIAEVRDVFRSPKLGAIAGCMVTSGVVKRNNPIRVLRDNVVIYEGALESLRRFKDDAAEVREGMECGIGVKNYNDVKVGDHIEVFEVTEVKRVIE